MVVFLFQLGEYLVLLGGWHVQWMDGKLLGSVDQRILGSIVAEPELLQVALWGSEDRLSQGNTSTGLVLLVQQLLGIAGRLILGSNGEELEW